MQIIRSVNFQRRTYYNPDHPIVIRNIITAGLGGVVQQMINNGQWGIVSTHDDGNELKNYLRQKGIGFIMMQGAWVDEELSEYINFKCCMGNDEEQEIAECALRESQNIVIDASALSTLFLTSIDSA